MDKFIKAIFLIIILPTPAWAIVCATTDTACQQLETLKSVGMSPTPIQKAKNLPGIAPKTKASSEKQTIQTQSFTIPKPQNIQPKTKAPLVTDTFNRTQPTQSVEQQKKMSVPMNIYAPFQQNTTTSDTSKTTENNPNESKEQKPFTIPKPSPVGIQYR